ncbi:rubrerythrin family protein [Chloroflexota bacterium]
MSKTQDNLAEAFAGESQANRRYLFFAEKAEKEGYKKTARLFRAAAAAETVHARNHSRAIGEIKTTKENLQASVSGENYEFSVMYPSFITEAQTEGNKVAENSFDLANQVEKIHHGLFQASLDSLEESGKEEGKPYSVCQVCGNTIEGEAPERCPICGAPKNQFKQVE